MSKSVFAIIVCAAVCLSLPAFADTVNVVSSSGLGANDSVNWSQLGPDGANFFENRVVSAQQNTITLGTNDAGVLAVTCPGSPSCSWNGGFAPGETLLHSVNASQAPLILFFQSTPTPTLQGLGTGIFHNVFGAGFTVDAMASGSFTVVVQALMADGSVLGFSLNSNAQGDPLFVGLLDLDGANISGLLIDVIHSGSNHNFLIGSLSTKVAVPEPASIALFGLMLVGLIGLVWRRRPTAQVQ